MVNGHHDQALVDDEIEVTTWRATSSSASSLLDHRDSGTPEVAGSAQASSLISAITKGGKGSGSTRTMTIREPVDAFLEPPFPWSLCLEGELTVRQQGLA